MLFQTAKTSKGKFVVCGSGPSLDHSINDLKRSAVSSIVCGGGYKALVEAGPLTFLPLWNVITILEHDYAGFHDSIGGAPDSVHLVMAAECYQNADTFLHCTF